MSVPPLLTAPLQDLTPRQRRGFFWACALGLGLVLGTAAWARFSWPPWPLSDADTWGYLHPALAKLRGEGFVHTYSRNFLYPGWVYLLLWIFGTFRAVTVGQHLLGLATGGLLWLLWRQWRASLTATRLPAWADALLGLALVTFFLRSGSVLHFEHQIRPEAIFPFFAALDVCLLFGFLSAWFRDRHPRRAAWRGGVSVFVTALLYQLKPSFGLTVGVALLPLPWAFVHPWTRDPFPRRALVVTVSVAVVLATFLLVVPERRFAASDEFSREFLPETLLTVHAGLIHQQLEQDVRDRVATPLGPEFLATASDALGRELLRAAHPESKPYESLGYNPDFLMYRRDSFCRWLYDRLPAAQANAFCYRAYGRAAWHHPLGMAAKIGRQLRIFYSLHCPAFWPAAKFKEEKLYRKTNEALNWPNYQQTLHSLPLGATYLQATARLQRSGAEYRLPSWTVKANVVASVCYLPILGLFLAGLAFVRTWPAEQRTGWWASGSLVALVYGLNFGNCLTISVVHSLDVARYSYNLLVYAAWCELAALVWLGEVVAFVGRRRTEAMGQEARGKPTVRERRV